MGSKRHTSLSRLALVVLGCSGFALIFFGLILESLGWGVVALLVINVVCFLILENLKAEKSGKSTS